MVKILEHIFCNYYLLNVNCKHFRFKNKGLELFVGKESNKIETIFIYNEGNKNIIKFDESLFSLPYNLTLSMSN